nr:spermatogenesis-associated protein 20 isoform X2 [Ipomoea batatas]
MLLASSTPFLLLLALSYSYHQAIKVYVTYVSALYGSGGWPLSVFLSPDLKPLMGGTYFLPDDAYGRPGFKTILSPWAGPNFHIRAAIYDEERKVEDGTMAGQRVTGGRVNGSRVRKEVVRILDAAVALASWRVPGGGSTVSFPEIQCRLITPAAACAEHMHRRIVPVRFVRQKRLPHPLHTFQSKRRSFPQPELSALKLVLSPREAIVHIGYDGDGETAAQIVIRLQIWKERGESAAVDVHNQGQRFLLLVFVSVENKEAKPDMSRSFHFGVGGGHMGSVDDRSDRRVKTEFHSYALRLV